MAATELDYLKDSIRKMDAEIRHLRASIGPLASNTQRLLLDRLMAGPSAAGQVLVSEDAPTGDRFDWAWSAFGPVNGPYVTIGNDATLTAERALTAGTGITIVDGGANGTVTVSVGSHDHTGASDGGILTGDIHDSYLELIEVATPANPATDRGRLFTRANGSNIELVFLSSQGNECIICSEPDNTVSAELQLNWVE